jgi:hypothetical protein
MLRVMAVIAFGIAGNSSAQPAAPYSYQGNVLGVTTYQEFASRLDSADAATLSVYYCKEPVNGLRSCKTSASVDTHYWFVDEKLARASINFNSSAHLADYLEGLTQKFGRPVKTTVPYQNGFGASRIGRVWTWHNATGGVTLEEIGQQQELDTGALTYYDTKLRAEFLNRFDPKPKL